MMTTFCLARAHAQVASSRTTDLSMPRAGSTVMSSRIARPVPSFASLSRRDSRRLSRSVHSRSTSMPTFSSKERALPGAVARISRSTLAIVCSLMSLSFWIVSSVITCLLLVEVRSAAHVVVRDRASRCARRRDGGVLDAAFEDRLDVLTSRPAWPRGGESACARGIGTWATILLGGPHETEETPVPHLGPRVAREDLLGDPRDGRPERSRPGDHALGRPRAVVAVRLRAVLLDGHVGALAAVRSTM